MRACLQDQEVCCEYVRGTARLRSVPAHVGVPAPHSARAPASGPASRRPRPRESWRVRLRAPSGSHGVYCRLYLHYFYFSSCCAADGASVLGWSCFATLFVPAAAPIHERMSAAPALRSRSLRSASFTSTFDSPPRTRTAAPMPHASAALILNGKSSKNMARARGVDRVDAMAFKCLSFEPGYTCWSLVWMPKDFKRRTAVVLAGEALAIANGTRCSAKSVQMAFTSLKRRSDGRCGIFAAGVVRGLARAPY